MCRNLTKVEICWQVQIKREHATFVTYLATFVQPALRNSGTQRVNWLTTILQLISEIVIEFQQTPIPSLTNSTVQIKYGSDYDISCERVL